MSTSAPQDSGVEDGFAPFTLGDIRDICAHRPPDAAGFDLLDDLLDELALQELDRDPKMPEETAFSAAAALVSLALTLGDPDRGGGGNRAARPLLPAGGALP